MKPLEEVAEPGGSVTRRVESGTDPVRTTSNDPQAKNPQAKDPQAKDPQAKDPQAQADGRLNGMTSTTREPDTREPETPSATELVSRYKLALTRSWSQLVDDLEPLPLLDSLFSETVLSREEYDTAQAKETRQEKARCLLDLLQRKGRRAFEEFSKMLGQGPQKHLNDNLLEIQNSITEEDLIESRKTAVGLSCKLEFWEECPGETGPVKRGITVHAKDLESNTAAHDALLELVAKFYALPWGVRDGSLILQLGFLTLEDLTRFWLACHDGRLETELVKLLSETVEVEEGWTLKASVSIDPEQYARAVAKLASGQGKGIKMSVNMGDADKDSEQSSSEQDEASSAIPTGVTLTKERIPGTPLKSQLSGVSGEVITLEHLAALKKNKSYLEEQMVADIVVNTLQHRKVITAWDAENIKVKKTSHEMNQALISYMQEKPDYVFQALVSALMSTGQEHVAKALVPKLPAASSSSVDFDSAPRFRVSRNRGSLLTGPSVLKLEPIVKDWALQVYWAMKDSKKKQPRAELEVQICWDDVEVTQDDFQIDSLERTSHPQANTLFRTTFFNNSSTPQEYSFKATRTTRSTCQVDVETGILLWKDATAVHLRLPMQVLQSSPSFPEKIAIKGGLGARVEEPLQWSVDSQLRVSPMRKTTAELVVFEESMAFKFEGTVLLRGIVQVQISSAKEGPCFFEGSIQHILLQHKEETSTRHLLTETHRAGGKSLTMCKLSGSCFCNYAVEQSINIQEDPMPDGTMVVTQRDG